MGLLPRGFSVELAAQKETEQENNNNDSTTLRPTRTKIVAERWSRVAGAIALAEA